MKIKFNISQISEFTPEVIIEKIVSQLNSEDYIIVDRTRNTITFKDNNWGMRPKNEIFRKVDKGSFEVTSANEGTLIRYIYYISFLPEIVITAIVLFGTFTLSHLVLLIALPLWIQLGIRIFTLKDVSSEMIKRLAI